MTTLDVSSTGSRLSEALLNGRETITYREIRSASLPLFIRTWFHLCVEAWYAPEYRRRKESARFNYRDESVKTTLEGYDAAVKDTARFSPEDCGQIIEKALTHEQAYALHPVGAIIELLFRRADVVDGVHVVEWLDGFRREAFYIDALKRHVVEHEDTRLDRELLEQFLTNAERETYQKQPSDALITAIRAVSEFLALTGGNGHADQIGFDTWETFFLSRRLDETFPELMETMASSRADRYGMTIDELQATFFRTSEDPAEETVMEEAEIPVEPVQEEPMEEPVQETQTPAMTMSAPESEPPSIFAAPTGYAREAEPVSEPVLSDPEDAQPPMPASEEDESELPPSDPMLKETIANTVSPVSGRSVAPPVEINDKLQKMFIKKLFNKDEAAYQEVITRLEPALSWEESFSIIEEIWQERGLNLFSKESQEFTRVYYERYFPPG